MQRLIYLIRHGEIERCTPRRFVGRIDLPLTANGIRQAQALGEQLRPVPFAAVFASPLQRARQTAALVGGRPVEEVRAVADLAEIDLGDWEGRTVAEVRQCFPGGYEARGRDLAGYRPQGGESFGDVAARAWPAFLALAAEYSGPLLIVAHAGVNRVILSRLLQRPIQELLTIPQEYCGVNILRKNGSGLEVAAVNLTGPMPAPHHIATTGSGDSV